ncbi:metallophosphoesterase [Aromatoleum toluclasticum]|uniref:metallophosphoesterase family protein n=1 Tax=Aromatoleum toluclasticum TaxID=92003 RepID=UPI001D18E051|nr:metallophosphoesterase [Aromatoleum toluclasticum]MCC4115348.1 metallophosphoesterase [Aromatoleum toluclasticum]
MNQKLVTFALLSDLHAAPRSSDPKGTEVKLYSDGDSFGQHDSPLSSLYELINREGLTADFVICPGDMTNRADGGALKFVWDQLHKLRETLGAQQVIATVGNHDVDSRGHDVGTIPREALMRLVPRFPIPVDALADHFWAHGYFMTTIGAVRFLVLNSSWLHEHRDELERGAVTSYTLEKLRRDLDGHPPAKFNVAVCHHHPHVHSELDLGSDIMHNGQKLLDVLSGNGAWLVIHGHKHHPKVELAQGEFQQPIVLACGSFSGRLEGANATVSRNYFHMVHVEHVGEDAELRGVVESWNWVSGLGWERYGNANSTFPSRLGFGFEGSIPQLVRAVAESMGTHQLKRWEEMVKLQPDLAHLTPRKLNALCSTLQSKYNILIARDETGLPSELGVRST